MTDVHITSITNSGISNSDERLTDIAVLVHHQTWMTIWEVFLKHTQMWGRRFSWLPPQLWLYTLQLPTKSLCWSLAFIFRYTTTTTTRHRALLRLPLNVLVRSTIRAVSNFNLSNEYTQWTCWHSMLRVIQTFMIQTDIHDPAIPCWSSLPHLINWFYKVLWIYSYCRKFAFLKIKNHKAYTQYMPNF